MQDEHESLKTHDVTWHKPSIASRNEQDRSQHRAALCEACIMWGSCTGTFVEPYVTSLAPQLLSMMETPQYKHNARQRYTYGEKENELLQEKVNQYEKEKL